jgi:hypothetical protein
VGWATSLSTAPSDDDACLVCYPDSAAHTFPYTDTGQSLCAITVTVALVDGLSRAYGYVTSVPIKNARRDGQA